MKTASSLQLLAAAALALAAAGCSTHAGGAGAAGRSAARISPSPATVNTQLSVVLEAPGVSPALCRYTWSCNGQPIAGADGAVLGPDRFRKGDLVAVVVTPPDAAGAAAKPMRADVRIVDAAPVVRSAHVGFDPAGGGDDLQATTEYADPDGDEVTLSYRWFRNGRPIAEASGDRLAAASFANGDRIAVEVTASTGAGRSEPRRSDEFTLGNRAPRFATDPVVLGADAGSYRYQVKATDPDGDALRYELPQAPAGMSISPEGTIAWTPIASSAAGEYVVTVRATDARGGEATQQFTIRLTAAQVASTKP